MPDWVKSIWRARSSTFFWSSAERADTLSVTAFSVAAAGVTWLFAGWAAAACPMSDSSVTLGALLGVSGMMAPCLRVFP